MPPRPPFLLRHLATPSKQWTCPSCATRTLPHLPRLRPRMRAPRRRTPDYAQTSSFHSTHPLRGSNPPTHYETLQLTLSASAAEIKRQFYTLSKKHHPDRNQNDPEASTRFVAISEAYHVLSAPEKRAQYDATLQSAQPSSWGGRSTGSPRGEGYPQGSYSSASFGSRPASGLNKKRSTFRGPPPSFYKSGGYGEFGAKRSEYAYQATPDGKEERAGQESYGEYGGFGPGQQRHGKQVPHFDDKRHKETHDNVYAHIWARRRQMRKTVRSDEEYARGDVLVNFLAVSGIIGVIGATAKMFGDRQEAREHAMRNEGA
ncbi:DnaJ-domain-containing protein [Plenodomus tracheiphilus IPT5]|uniref:DnaJ-domain-containing protein n=1 Tax=Plenodomus tracheiphilus IPT5 TaxID=1408161 RepID=A0A6A7ASN1_9PLEO|nr:DnaJ-domain-containing protein [Plenodomus tracheiphilus IPT5]